MKSLKLYTLIVVILISNNSYDQKKSPRDYGIEIGVLKTGELNAITDVKGVLVGQITLVEGDNIRTGVTAILPHGGNLYQEKVPAAIYIGNGFGKLAGYSQVKELGNLETPIILTNTLSVPAASDALVSYTLDHEGNENVRSVNPLVGETNDGFLNDIRSRFVKEEHILKSIEWAKSGIVSEGNVGAGTGTVCFGFKGGIGSSSRKLPDKAGGYTIGVLVQTNFGGVLQIDGVQVGKMMKNYGDNLKYSADGSCMIVVATDAPVDARNLERLAKRAFLGLAKTGGIGSNGSGDYIIAFSTAAENRIQHDYDGLTTSNVYLQNDAMTPLFAAAIEATEEAILNSLFAAETMIGRDGNKIDALPVDQVLEIMKK